MVELVAHKCPNCGAELPASKGASFLKCEFCGQEVDVRRAPAPAPAPAARPYVPLPIPPIPPAKRARGARAVGCVIFFLIAAAAAGPSIYFATRNVGGGLAGSTFGPRMIFQKMVGFFHVNGDGIEDLVLQVRFIDQNDALHVVVLDGRDLGAMWQAGPFGSYSQGYQYTHAAVVGNRVLVTDFRAAGHLFDLASGTAIASVPLPDRAKNLCVDPAGGTRVWVEVDNGNHAVLDTATGSTQPSPAAPWGGGCAASADLTAPKPPPGSLEIQIQGFASEEVLSDGENVVAVGRRAAGIRVPMAVGLGPDGRTPAWTAVPVTVDEALYKEDVSHETVFRLAGGRLFCAYSLVNDTGRLAALDARSGTRLWEAELPACCAHGVDVEDMMIGPTRILTQQFGQAEVFDVQTGQMIGRVAPR